MATNGIDGETEMTHEVERKVSDPEDGLRSRKAAPPAEVSKETSHRVGEGNNA